MAFGKRKRVTAPRRGGFKKRRTNRRRRTNVTSMTRWASTGSTENPFRSRKLSARKYRSMLWDSTMFKTHYRSADAQIHTLSTPASQITQNVTHVPADNNGVDFFWLGNGGAVTPDSGVAMPTLRHDLLLRGGIMTITCTNNVLITAPVKVTITGVKSGLNYDPTNFNGVYPIGWDYTMFPEFKKSIGTTVCQKSFILGNQDSATMTMRARIAKIDQDDHATGYRRWYWILRVHNLETGLGQDVTFMKSFNFSFTGDAA